MTHTDDTPGKLAGTSSGGFDFVSPGIVQMRDDSTITVFLGDQPGQWASCIYDSHHGWHNLYNVIELAQQHGFKLAPGVGLDPTTLKEDEARYQHDLDAFKGGSDDPNVADLIDNMRERAEQYLNDQVLTPGFTFDWFEGDFFFANEAWWEAVGS